MSTILKALKKLEAEKRATKPVPLSGHILAESGGQRQRPRRLPLVAAGAAVGVLFAAAAIGLYGWLLPPPPPPVTAVLATIPAPPRPVAAPLASPPEAGAAVSTKSPVGQEAPVQAPPAIKPQPPQSQAARVREPASQPARSAKQMPMPDSRAGAVAAASRMTMPGSQPDKPQLAVTEIFPASEGSGRMAVVNGLPVMEGTRVDGSLVREIRPGEVLFEVDGKNVVVPLQSAGR